ncbi:class I SAM-dependent methyltransferase [Nocardioides speluncae]|uniref:class I SAM-dependent methyltransferase n=1 Tax=Nocardioides speluncae TaxID=2670337 RepID=UPI000D68F7A2|nr:class I SAM-dependent methyltransferase [Nocardioides speluncae]
MKKHYVTVMRGLRAALRAIGVLALLDRWAARSRAGVWVRSLFSIYDLADLLRYDVPWWTFRSADLVSDFLEDKPAARVFEWGSGASTVWLGRRSATVTSVEHDRAWADTMAEVLPGNASLKVVEPLPSSAGVQSAKAGFEGLDFSSYVAAIEATDGDFDLIVIDGRAREVCLERALPRLAEGGLIVLDNVDRARYREAIDKHCPDLNVTWTRGLTPSLPYPTRTALISRSA